MTEEPSREVKWSHTDVKTLLSIIKGEAVLTAGGEKKNQYLLQN